MVRKIFLFVFICLFCMNLSAAEKIGYTLLDKLVMTFKDMAEHGTGGREIVEPAIEEMMAEAKKAKDEGQINPIFFRRYNRILMVIKLSIAEDSEGILGTLIEKEVGGFVEDILGEKADIKGGRGIGKVAQAIAEEIINMHMYLDNRKNREKLMEEYIKKSTIKKK